MARPDITQEWTYISVFENFVLSVFRSKDLIVLKVFGATIGFHNNCILIRRLDTGKVTLQYKDKEKLLG